MVALSLDHSAVRFLIPLSSFYMILMFSHMIYNVGRPSSTLQVGFMCLFLLIFFFLFFTPVFHHSLLYLHYLVFKSSSGLIGQLNFNPVTSVSGFLSEEKTLSVHKTSVFRDGKQCLSSLVRH